MTDARLQPSTMNPNKRLKRDPSSLSPSPGPSSSPLAGASSTVAGRRKPSAAAGGNEDDFDFELDEDLERQRKEAIYRRLLHYRREGAREIVRAERLEKQRQKLEAGVRAVEACWAELVVAVGTAVNAQPELLLAAKATDDEAANVPHDELQALQRWADEEDRDALTPSAESVEPALRRQLPITRDLVSRVVAAALSNASSANDLDPSLQRLNEQIERYASRCAALRTTLAAVRSENAELRRRAGEAERERETVEGKLDRVRMSGASDRIDEQGHAGVKRSREAEQEETSAAAGPSNGVVNHRSATSPTTAENASLPNGHSAPASDDAKKPVSGAPPSADNDRDVASLRARLAAKQLELEAAVDDARQAREDAGYFRSVVHAPPEEIIANSASLAVIKATLEEQMTIAREARARHERSAEEADTLRDGQEAFRESVIHEARAELDQLRSHLRAKEADVARLRGQRDGFREEIEVRKAEQASQHVQDAEMKALAEARAERLTIMRSEVTRLRSKLAATAGEEDYLAFLLRSGEAAIEDDISYVRDMEQRVRQLEAETNALKSQLAEAAQGSPDAQAAIAAETQTRMQLAQVQKTLADREALFQGGTEVSQLAQQLEEKDKVIRRLELQVQEADAVSSDRVKYLSK